MKLRRQIELDADLIFDQSEYPVLVLFSNLNQWVTLNRPYNHG
jgi:hypothetical protein